LAVQSVSVEAPSTASSAGRHPERIGDLRALHDRVPPIPGALDHANRARCVFPALALCTNYARRPGLTVALWVVCSFAPCPTLPGSLRTPRSTSRTSWRAKCVRTASHCAFATSRWRDYHCTHQALDDSETGPTVSGGKWHWVCGSAKSYGHPTIKMPVRRLHTVRTRNEAGAGTFTFIHIQKRLHMLKTHPQSLQHRRMGQG
jgi:hypothetical protein